MSDATAFNTLINIFFFLRCSAVLIIIEMWMFWLHCELSRFRPLNTYGGAPPSQCKRIIFIIRVCHRLFFSTSTSTPPLPNQYASKSVQYGYWLWCGTLWFCALSRIDTAILIRTLCAVTGSNVCTLPRYCTKPKRTRSALAPRTPAKPGLRMKPRNTVAIHEETNK